jgi:hypothetical protein
MGHVPAIWYHVKVVFILKPGMNLDLDLDPDKTDMVVFTRKRKFPGLFEPQFLRVTLQRSESTEYVGVILDSRLTWREQR